MEVRSKAEQCGSDATTAAIAAISTSINQSVDSKTSTDAVRAVANMDLSRTTVTDETKQPLTRDESEYFVFFFSQQLFASYFAIRYVQLHIWKFNNALK